MTVPQYITYILIIYISYYEGDCCFTTLQYIDMASVSCDRINEPLNCTVTCNQGYMFGDGSPSQVYQCRTNNTFSTTIYKMGCIQRSSPTFKMRLLVDYTFTVLAVSCLDSHEYNIMQNKELFRKKLSETCQQNLSIYNISSRTSSFSIYTMYEIEFVNTLYSRNVAEFCIKLIEPNIGTIMRYAGSLQCNSSNTSINISIVNTSTSVCPAFNQPIEDRNNNTYCDSVLPLVGIRQFSYVFNHSATVKLFCEVTGGHSLDMSVYWEHNGEEINKTPRFNGSTLAHPSLNILNVTSNDSGQYICLVRTKFGISRGMPITLTVLNGKSSDETKGSTTTEIVVNSGTETYTTSASVETSKIATDISTQGNISLQETSLQESKNIFDEYKILFVGIGAGLGGLIVVSLLVVALSKRWKNNSAGTSNIDKDTLRNDIQNELEDLEQDGLKDNLLYVSSEQPIRVNEHYSVVNDGKPTSAVDQKSHEQHSVPATNASSTGSISNKQSTPTPTRKSEFQNKAFQLPEEIQHINPENSGNDVYAVVNKKKHTDLYAEVKKNK